MRIAVGLLACLTAGSATIALAGDPPSAPAGAAVSAPAVATTPTAPAAAAASATAAAQPAAAPKADPAAAAVEAETKEKHFMSEGYKLEMHHGEKMFCRREEVLGSRLGAKNYCSTLEQLEQTERDARRAMERSGWQQNNPGGR